MRMPAALRLRKTGHFRASFPACDRPFFAANNLLTNLAEVLGLVHLRARNPRQELRAFIDTRNGESHDTEGLNNHECCGSDWVCDSFISVTSRSLVQGMGMRGSRLSWLRCGGRRGQRAVRAARLCRTSAASCLCPSSLWTARLVARLVQLLHSPLPRLQPEDGILYRPRRPALLLSIDKANTGCLAI